MNLLVLACLDLVGPARGKMLSRTAASHALSATVVITLLALTGAAIYLPPPMHFSIAGIGVGAWAVSVAYLLGLRVIFFNERIAAGQKGITVQMPARRTGLARALVGYAISAAVIVAAAPFLARSADRLAELSGLGNTFFGTTLLALCTTLPELVAGLTAVRMGAHELAIGNLFGSIAFNLFLLAPLDAAYSGSLLSAAADTHIITCLAVILVTSIAVLGQLYQVERRIHFIEPDAALVIVLSIGSLVLIYFLR
jgi:cation:H+ antiporter